MISEATFEGGLRLRPLAKGDLDAVRQLRNSNRQWFFDDREVTAEDQARWFERLRDRPVAFYVIEMDGRVIGTVSVTTGAAESEIGNLILDPACRGKGIMRQVVEKLTTEPGSYFADVKFGNDPSINVFLNTGFASHTVRLRKKVV